MDSVWNQYRDGLVRFVRSRVSNADDAEDLVQEILLKAMDNLPTLRMQSSIKPWLYQIASTTIADFYRRQTRSALHLSAGDLWYESDPDDREQAMQSLAQCVAPFVNALSAQGAALLTAIDIEGQSQKAYAQAAGLSYSTVKSRVQKARAELRQLFERCCYFSRDGHGNLTDFVKKSKACDNC